MATWRLSRYLNLSQLRNTVCSHPSGTFLSISKTRDSCRKLYYILSSAHAFCFQIKFSEELRASLPRHLIFIRRIIMIAIVLKTLFLWTVFIQSLMREMLNKRNTRVYLVEYSAPFGTFL